MRTAVGVLAAVGIVVGVAAPATASRAEAEPGTASAVLRTDNIRSLEYWLDDYGIRDAWATTRGRGQTIAIIDSGVDSTHPDLAGAVVGGADFSGAGAANGQKPVPGADSEHGTLVASLAAGRGTAGGNGVIGAAPEASLLSLSIGYGTDADSDDQIADAVRWAVDHGATIINMSLTRNTRDWPTSWDSAFLYAEQHQVVVVAAAGNRGSGTDEVGAPATMPGVLVVAGVGRNGVASQDASSQGITLGVAAPSEQLVGDLPGGRFATWSGTSGAAPIVSGIVALVRAAHPELNAANVIERVLATARDRGPAGPDVTYGYGLVDAEAAVTATVAPVSTNPLGSMADWIATYRPSSTASDSAEPTPRLPDPPRASRFDPVGVLLPSPAQLLFVALPLGVLIALAVPWAVLVAGAVRAAKRRRRTR